MDIYLVTLVSWDESDYYLYHEVKAFKSIDEAQSYFDTICDNTKNDFEDGTIDIKDNYAEFSVDKGYIYNVKVYLEQREV